VRTRTHRTPLSIWIAVGYWLLVVATKTVFVIGMAVVLARFGAYKYTLNGQFLGLIIALYQAFALARLSRWPVLVHPIAAVVSLFSLYGDDSGLRERFPLLAPLAAIIPLVISLALTLPHWRKMNWALFGRPYRPLEDRAEVFS
jgi:hypothetical protein